MEKNLVSLSDIEHLAKLSGFVFSDEQKEDFQTQVSSVIDLLNGCASVETDDRDYDQIQALDDLRADNITPSLNIDTALEQAYGIEKEYLCVPMVEEVE